MNTYIEAKGYKAKLPVEKYTIKNEIAAVMKDALDLLSKAKEIDSMNIGEREAFYLKVNSVIEEMPDTIKRLRNLKTRDKG